MKTVVGAFKDNNESEGYQTDEKYLPAYLCIRNLLTKLKKLHIKLSWKNTSNSFHNQPI